MMYQNIEWPNDPEVDYYNYDHSIQVELDMEPDSFYFWSIQFWFQNGAAGYMGLQTDVLSNDGQNLGRGFNVAIWDAIDARPENGVVVRPDTDGDKGGALYLPHEWKAGTVYHFRIWELQADEDGIWWGFFVTDKDSQESFYLGSLKTPMEMKRLNAQSVVWTEYYGANNTAPCDDPIRKETSVLFLNPVRNAETILPIHSYVDTPNCPRYKLVEKPAFAVSQQVTKLDS
jgi:Domain of unknown function (DUF3472)